MKKKTTYLLLPLALMLLASCQQKKVHGTPAPILVETEVLVPTTMQGRATYVGRIEPRSSTSLSFVSGGYIQAVAVHEGDRVQKGQLVASLDESSAQSALKAAEAMLRQAKDGYGRSERLHAEGVLPEVKWIEIQTKVTEAQSTYEVAKEQLAHCRLTAPCSGVIGSIFKVVGEATLPAMPIATILDIDQVQVVVSVPEKEVIRIDASTPSTITVATLADRTFAGGTITKAVTADAMTHTYDIRIALANPDHALLPGMVCEVQLDADAAVPVLTVPVRVVGRDVEGRSFVWTVRDGCAHRTSVELGTVSGSRIQVTKGLAAQDRVIVAGYQKLGEGTQIVERP